MVTFNFGHLHSPTSHTGVIFMLLLLSICNLTKRTGVLQRAPFLKVVLIGNIPEIKMDLDSFKIDITKRYKIFYLVAHLLLLRDCFSTTTFSMLFSAISFIVWRSVAVVSFRRAFVKS